MPEEKFKIALAQIAPVLGDLEKNIATHIAWAERAIGEGSNAIIFPELSLTGYTLRDLNFDLALNPKYDERLQPLRELSSQITIICGGAEESKEYGIYNSAFVFSEGECLATHRKVYPPTYGIFEELRYFSAGNSARAFTTNIDRIGVLVCEDLWHISLPYLLAADGANTIITIAASPAKLTGSNGAVPKNYEINSQHHCAYARLLSSYIIFVNRVGFEDGVNFWGGSEIVNPNGEVQAAAKFFEEDLIYGEIDLNEVRRARRSSRHHLDENYSFTQSALRQIIRERNNNDETV
jgi:predicted amidohydrolase